MAQKQQKLWSGVFSGPSNKLMDTFNASIMFDKVLFAEDIAGSKAYARGLHKAGVLKVQELKKIEKGLQIIKKRCENGTIQFNVQDEDIHMALEAHLHKLIGEIAKKLHTGRSRNEQVVLDVRMYLKKKIVVINKLITDLQAALIKRAEKDINVLMPGSTHLQQAQIIRFSHYILALFYMLERDKYRFADCAKRNDIMPLGSGALGGNTYNLPRAFIARELSFSHISENSIDAVSDRDFILEYLSCCSILSMHLSRFCEDFIIWSTPEFNFMELDEQFATGSSLMPQKKNPDSLELIRGKSGRIYSNLLTLLIVMKGLPLTYNKDMQEDKEPLFDSTETVEMVLEIFSGIIKTFKLKKKVINKWVSSHIYATDLVDELVKDGIPFRKAHKMVGESIKKGNYDQLLEKYNVNDPLQSVEKKNFDGGTSRTSVNNQIKKAKRLLSKKRNIS